MTKPTLPTQRIVIGLATSCAMARLDQIMKTLGSTTILATMLMASCVDTPEDTSTTGDDDSADTGDEAFSEDVAELSTPVYPTAHPRVYLGKNATRLKAAL